MLIRRGFRPLDSYTCVTPSGILQYTEDLEFTQNLITGLNKVAGRARASAFLYSILETAKANGLEPYWYLNYLFEKFPLSKGEEEYKPIRIQNSM